ncbi:MAG: hypothetical protein A2020_10325 [Lentisphaerae bacterium GWF2_45_14]|nr:MAG: hypothetical protein A2020_10325 [Lentisphaerae bacterium GWF2_45_14]
MEKKFFNRTLLFSTGLALMLGLCGCMDSVNTAENTQKTMTPSFVPTKRIVTDGYLDNRLKAMATDKVELPNGLLKIQVTLKSTRIGLWDWLVKGNRPYRIAYRFEWFDKDGMLVNTASSVWLEKEVLPGDTLFIASVAPNERCKDFILRLKELE